MLHLHETRLDKGHCVFSDKINRQIVGIVGTDSGFVMRENQPASEMSPPIENGRALMELSRRAQLYPGEICVTCTRIFSVEYSFT